MRISKCTLLLLIIGCFVFSLFTEQASADIAVGPLTKTIQVAPGRSKTVVYKVANHGKEPIVLTISARTWFALPENKDIEISDWLNLKTKKVRLSPGRTKRLRFRVKVPKNAVGELAGMIYFTPERKAAQMLGTSYGVSLYVFVKGTEKIEPAIGDVLISKREEKSYLAVTIENKGNVHFRPKVNATAKVGEKFKEDLELPFGKPIFGGQKYTFVGKFEGKLPEIGTCLVDVLCNYGKGKGAILKKSVSLNLGEIKE